MSLARLGHSGGGSAKGSLTTKNLYDSTKGQKADDGQTVEPGTAQWTDNTKNLPATTGFANGPNPTRPKAGPAGKFQDVLTPGGQRNP